MTRSSDAPPGPDRMPRIIDEYLSSLEGDRPLSEDEVLSNNPDIASDLQAEFTKLRQIMAAQRAADQDTRCEAALRTGPEVRCPYCHARSEASMDESFRLMRCYACGNTFSLIKERTDSFVAGAMLGRFELVERLGAGGFGSVWKALDTDLERHVALKVPRRTSGRGDREQILREARAAARLHHPNIVRVHEVGLDDDTVYIASDLIDGVPLSEHLKRGRYTFRESAALCEDVARALHHAHSAGVVHRDLKPQNVLIGTGGVPFLTDFGLARHESTDVTMTIDGQVIGTPAYMSPEQATGNSHVADGRSDIFSFGVMLFEMLTGVVPFRGTPPMVLSQVVADEPTRPRKLNNQIPVDLETICLKCMEKQPELRYQNAAELADELDRFLNDQPIVARPIGPVNKALRWSHRNPALASLGVIVFATTLASVVLLGVFFSQLAVARANQYYADLLNVREMRSSGTEGHREEAERVAAKWKDYAYANGEVESLQQEVVASLGDFAGVRGKGVSFGDRLATTATVADSGMAAVGMRNGEVHLFDMMEGKLLNVFRGHTPSTAVRAIRFFSADGKANEEGPVDDDASDHVEWRIASVGSDGTVMMSTGSDAEWKHEQVLKWPQEAVSARFSDDGKLLAVHDGKQIDVFGTSNWKRVFSCQSPDDYALRNLAISPDGIHLAAGYDDEISHSGLHLWRMDQPVVVHTKQVDRGSTYEGGMSFSPDGRLLAFVCELVIVYEMPTLERISSVQKDETSAVAIGPNSKYIAALDIRGEIDVRSLRTQAPIAVLRHSLAGQRGILVRFNADGNAMYSLDASTFRQWDLRITKERAELSGHEQGVPTVVFSPDGRFLLTGGKDGLVKIWNASDGRFINKVNCGGMVQTVAYCADGDHVAVLFADKSTIEFWRVSDPKLIGWLDTTLEATRHLAFNQRGDQIAVCGDSVRVWTSFAIAGEQITAQPVALPAEVRANEQSMPADRRDWCVHLCFDDERNRLFWGRIYPDQSLHAWDLRTNEYGKLAGADFGGGWHGLEYLQKRGELLFVGGNGRLQLWDIASAALAKDSETDFQFRSSHIAVHPNRRWVAGLIEPNQVAIWDLVERQLFAFRPEETAVWSLAWSAKGDRLAVGLSAGGVVIWKLDEVKKILDNLGIPLLEPGDES